MAPSAAVISRAVVTSNGNTYLVKIRVASPLMLAAAVRGAARGRGGPMAACPTIRLEQDQQADPGEAAASRWP